MTPRHNKTKHFSDSRLFLNIFSFRQLEKRIARLPDAQSKGDTFEVFAEAYLAVQRPRQHDRHGLQHQRILGRPYIDPGPGFFYALHREEASSACSQASCRERRFLAANGGSDEERWTDDGSC